MAELTATLDPDINADSIIHEEFAVTDEQQELRAAVRRFCAERSDQATVRRLLAATPAFDRRDWSRLGAELGVLGLGVPEDLGGSGGGLVDAAIVVEELGAAMFCGPLFGTLMLSIPALAAAPPSPVRDQALGALIDGTRTAAFVDNATTDNATTATATTDAENITATVDADGWHLTGVAAQVVDAADADDLLVVASGPDGIVLLLVDATAPGVHRTRLTTMDQTRPQAHIRFHNAPAQLIAEPHDANAIRDHALRVGAVLLAAEQVGGSQHLLDICVEYAKTRLQFGRPIGSFQAVKHRLADMLVEQEHARSVAYHGAWALQDGTDDPDLAASIAQAVCSAASTRIARDAVQSHGGIGFTWEHEVHLYLKRAFTDAALLGSAEWHRDRIASLVLDMADPMEVEVATGYPTTSITTGE